MKKQIKTIIMLLYVVTILACFTACGKQELLQEATEVITETSKEQIDLLKNVWLSSSREAEKTDSWSLDNYTEDFLPQMKEGVLGTRLYALDNNSFWILTEIWKTQGEDNRSREYQFTKYDMNLEQAATFTYALKWDESIVGFDDLIQGMEQLTFHIVGMDCVDGIFSLLVEGSHKERNIPLFFVVLLLLIYALNSILNSDFEPAFLPIISFIKNFVAENVAKLPAEWCRVAFTLNQG